MPSSYNNNAVEIHRYAPTTREYSHRGLSRVSLDTRRLDTATPKPPCLTPPCTDVAASVKLSYFVTESPWSVKLSYFVIESPWSMKVSYFILELWKFCKTFLFGIWWLLLWLCNSRVHDTQVMYINTCWLATVVSSPSNVLSLSHIITFS